MRSVAPDLTGAQMAGCLAQGSVPVVGQPGLGEVRAPAALACARSLGHHDAVEMSVSSYGVCVTRTNGTVACERVGAGGPFGVLDTVPGTTDAVEVSMAPNGATTCARRSSGGVDCWGSNRYGQYGDGTTVDRPGPGPVPGITNAQSVATGGFSTCVALTTGRVECWGRGVPPDNSTTLTTPREVPGITTATKVVRGDSMGFCALLDDGTVTCWGLDAGVIEGPAPLPGLAGVADLDIASYFVGCAVLTDGSVSCWGYAGDPTPQPLMGLHAAATEVSATGLPCVLLADGSVRCWTRDLTVGSPIERIADVQTVDGGQFRQCAIDALGDPWCWTNPGTRPGAPQSRPHPLGLGD
jgi:hypothetical protein